MNTSALCTTPDARCEFDRLHEAYEQMEAASHAKSVLIAKLGHELKTPLNAMVGLAQLIRLRHGREPQPAAVDDWLEQIARLGWHMAEVVDTLMELGPSGAGRLRTHCETFDVLEPITEAMRIVQSDAARRDIAIGFVGETQAQVTADRRALRQVFVNLLSNAIKYNKEGGRVCVSVRGGEQVRVAVRDTGPGLTAAQRTRLFQAFDRLGAEHTAVEGHGLGLLLCRELLLAMGGTIDVDGVEGAGCTFNVTLPPRHVIPKVNYLTPTEREHTQAKARGSY